MDPLRHSFITQDSTPISQAVLEDTATALRHIGAEIAVSPWIEVTQERISAFGRNTGDEYWLHMDPERARRESPFGATIAHGFLLLSLLAEMFYVAMHTGTDYSGLNYGLNRVRFVSPVRAGSRIRSRFVLAAVKPFDAGADFTWSVTVECEGAAKPALVAEWITRIGFP